MRFTRLTLILFAVGIVPLFLVGRSPFLFRAVLAYDALLLVLCVVDRSMTPKPKTFRLERRVEDTLSLGEANPVDLEILNSPAFSTRLEIRDEYPAGFRADRETCPLSVGPGVRGRVRYRVTPLARGEYGFGSIHFRYPSLLRLVHLAGKVEQPKKVQVYPNLVGLRRYELRRRRSHLQYTGIRVARRRGEGSEFESLREYVPDDDFRWINWKATAKHQYPIVQNFEPEKNQTVLLVLDAGRRMTTEVEGMSKLDYAVSAALLLGYVASDMGDQVGMLLFGGEKEVYLPPRKGKGQVERILENLYAVRPEQSEPDYPSVLARLAGRSKRRALVIVFTDVTDQYTSRNLLAGLSLLRPRHLPLVVAIADRSLHRRRDQHVRTAGDVYRKAVAGDLLDERARIVRSMANSGALVLDRLPEEISPETVNAYLEIKRKRLL
jgi:uncharacterized protein (DUF58 family)